MHPYSIYILATAATIQLGLVIYNLILHSTIHLRIQQVERNLYRNADYRERMATIAHRDYQTLKSIRFNHLLHFITGLLTAVAIIITLAL